MLTPFSTHAHTPARRLTLPPTTPCSPLTPPLAVTLWSQKRKKFLDQSITLLRGLGWIWAEGLISLQLMMILWAGFTVGLDRAKPVRRTFPGAKPRVAVPIWLTLSTTIAATRSVSFTPRPQPSLLPDWLNGSASSVAGFCLSFYKNTLPMHFHISVHG